MKKSGRLDALEAEVDQMSTQLEAIRRRLATLESPCEAPPRPPQDRSVIAGIRAELRDRRDWLLEAVGL